MMSLACDWLWLSFIFALLAFVAFAVSEAVLGGLLEELWLSDRATYQDLLSASGLRRDYRPGNIVPKNFAVRRYARRYLLYHPHQRPSLNIRLNRYRICIRIAIIASLAALFQILLCLAFTIDMQLTVS